MAGADVIGAAICITLLVLVAYVVVGSIMTTSGIVINAQDDMTRSQEERLGTSITIANYHYQYDTWDATYGDLWRIDFRVLNKGNQVIKNINKMDVMVIKGSDPPLLYKNGLGTFETKTWRKVRLERDSDRNAEIINPNQWDPGEYMYGQVSINFDPSTTPTQLQVVLANAVEATTVTEIYSE